MDPTITKARSAVGVDVRLGRDSTASRQRLAEAKLTAYIAKVVRDAPPLSAASKDKLVALPRSA